MTITKYVGIEVELYQASIIEFIIVIDKPKYDFKYTNRFLFDIRFKLQIVYHIYIEWSIALGVFEDR